MSTGSDSSQMYMVVVNHEAQYSIWPLGKVVPHGWTEAGKQGPKDACLEYIREVWTDMQPRSLRTANTG